jgi:tetratricopeptide (TPR) repeat protein/predicted Ser/Thr protein kinase
VTVGAGYRWDEADRLFDQALELPPDDRAAWLEQACAGNAALREQVEALLRADAAADRFLEFDALRCAGPVLETPEAEAGDGRRIGPYRVVRELARGGMGVVYLAERADGQFEQRVALKLIKRGMDSDEIHQRFLAERQILAQLNHPHIARLLDGGVSDQGQPYFAIEYIDGTALTAHCEARQLGVEERLRLFLDVCDAVRYAHQNLVVHRDLKPSNILVTADGQVKLLDFGIAKLLRSEPGAETGLTQTGLRVITPEYAAPEQVLGTPVTTATDVYALGAVLYELLTGRRAHQFDHWTPAEIARVVCGVDPAPPSMVAPPDLRGGLRGDLDTIALTALRKEPDRRYLTVEQLAGDIRRSLSGLPVTARPDTWRYRTTKFVGRHRLGVAAAAAIALSLVVGLAGTIWQARVAAERARAAADEAAQARAVSDFLVRLFQASDPSESPGRDLTAEELLDRGRRELDTALTKQPALRSELLTVVAAVYRSIGHGEAADTLFDEAIALTRRLPGDVDSALAVRLVDWGDNLLDQGKIDRADSLLQEAVARMRRVRPDDPALAKPVRMLARAETFERRLDRATSLAREALALDLRHQGDGSFEVGEDLDALSEALRMAGKLSEADSASHAALAIWGVRVGPDHPRALWSRANLAAVREAQGDDDEAMELLKEVAAGQRRIYPNGHAELARTYMSLGELFAKRGRYAEAESLMVEALAFNQPMLGANHSHMMMLRHNLESFRSRLGKDR